MSIGGLGPLTYYGILTTFIAALGLYIAVRRRANLKHRLEFRAAVSRSYAEYEAAYREAYQKLSKEWDVIEIIHDLSENNLGPAGLPEEITYEQSFEIVRQIKAARNGSIAIITHTNGGFSMPTYMIAKALGQHRGKKVAFVPYTAMSGGTVIALATEEIVMGDAAALGPIDTVYWGWPVSALEYLTATKNPDRIEDRYVMLSHVAGKFEVDAVERAKKHINAKHRPTVAHELISAGRYHGDTISPEEAREIGINVSLKPCRKEVYALVDARLRMVSLQREDVVRRRLDMPPVQRMERSQKWRGNNLWEPRRRFLG